MRKSWATTLVAVFVFTTSAWASCDDNLSGPDFIRSHVELNSYVGRFAARYSIDPDDYADDDAFVAFGKFFGRVGRELNEDKIDPIELLKLDFGDDPKIATYLDDLDRRVRAAGLELSWNDVDACESARTSRGEIKLGAHRYAHEAPVAACVFQIEHELLHDAFDQDWRGRSKTHVDYVGRRFEAMVDDELRVRIAERDLLRRLREAGFEAPIEIATKLSLEIWAAEDAGASREELWKLVAAEYAEFTAPGLLRDWVTLQRLADERELRVALKNPPDEVVSTAIGVMTTSLWAGTMNFEEKAGYFDWLAGRIGDPRLTEVRRRMLSEPDALDL